MSLFFDETYYLKSKLAQLTSKGETDADGNEYTLLTLQKAIADAGMTPETHYQQFGCTEQLNPNPYFNEAEYLIAKTKQVNSIAQDGRTNWTVDEVKAAIENIGLSPTEHYETFGGHETDAKGNLINPSNAFDANAYVVAKLAELVKTEPEKWAGKIAADVVAAIAENGMSPVTHYEMHGATEANAYGVPLVQTVPVSQRVENDPARAEVTGELVPSNYNAPTPPPAEVTADKAVPVTKPADVGGKANATVSPEVTPPAKPVPVPGDADYVAPPANIVDTNDKPVVVVPPAAEGGKPQFGVVGDNGTISGVDSTGKPTDTVIGKVDEEGTITPIDPTPEPDPEPTPDPTPDPKPDPEPIPETAFAGVIEDTKLTLTGKATTAPSVTLVDTNTTSTRVTLADGDIQPPLTGTGFIASVDASAVNGKVLTLDVSGKNANPLSILAQKTDFVTNIYGGEDKADAIAITGGKAFVDSKGGESASAQDELTVTEGKVSAVFREQTVYAVTAGTLSLVKDTDTIDIIANIGARGSLTVDGSDGVEQSHANGSAGQSRISTSGTVSVFLDTGGDLVGGNGGKGADSDGSSLGGNGGEGGSGICASGTVTLKTSGQGMTITGGEGGKNGIKSNSNGFYKALGGDGITMEGATSVLTLSATANLTIKGGKGGDAYVYDPDYTPSPFTPPPPSSDAGGNGISSEGSVSITSRAGGNIAITGGDRGLGWGKSGEEGGNGIYLNGTSLDIIADGGSITIDGGNFGTELSQGTKCCGHGIYAKTGSVSVTAQSKSTVSVSGGDGVEAYSGHPGSGIFLSTASSTLLLNAEAGSRINITGGSYGAVDKYVYDEGGNGIEFSGSKLTIDTGTGTGNIVITGGSENNQHGCGIFFSSTWTPYILTLTGSGNVTIGDEKSDGFYYTATVNAKSLTGDLNIRGSNYDASNNGRTGKDIITGGSGNDTINGLTGADTLTGGIGKDTLTGGEGADTFVYTSLAKVKDETGITLETADTITDFSMSQGDRIKITGTVGTDQNYAEGSPVATFDVAKSAADTAFAGAVVYYLTSTADGGLLFVDSNTDGTADAVIKLTGVTTTDFSAECIVA